MRARLLSGLTAAFAASAAAAVPALAQEPELDEAEVEAAIERGLGWLKSRQGADGGWDGGYVAQFPLGPTALGLLTVVKGADREDPAAQRAYRYLHERSDRLSRTYGVGILLMALEALYAPRPEQLVEDDEPYKTRTRKAFKRARRADKRLVAEAADWLMETRHDPMWGYPVSGGAGAPMGPPGGGGRPPGGGGAGGGEWDHSNTQYALLGLGAASRLGWRPKARDLFAVLEQLLAGQEEDGPDVEPFFIPAADATFEELDELAEDLAERRHEGDDTGTRVRRFYGETEAHPMKARGWAYFPVGGGGPANSHPAARMPQMHEPNNSMTAACLAAVIILKSLLEEERGYRRYGTAVDQAIRDGAAYLAHEWTVVDRQHPYYYLYGLERVGVLTGCHRFGDHDWYAEGGRHLLDAQNRDGSWGRDTPLRQGGFGEPPNALPQTCFAILFLARATVPLVPDLPERPRTGGDAYEDR